MSKADLISRQLFLEQPYRDGSNIDLLKFKERSKYFTEYLGICRQLREINRGVNNAQAAERAVASA